ncbi:filamentous hemagglutinin N-terminal domain-containing protein [Allosphingosinicella flava]|uniref:Filamentous hemagglutinin N-terminal domain-containing protein n=1 Tax=Allosphingosinicella flava TaxID=2771430 RepID=A0A7T2GKU6_9SPHN|nr:YDG domain-containing protein [Sphingosinicella flava]QPQ55368.1 filamentous hemagglutinin N-terminal domain-containing protein [Sphingosinicella flava]
MTAPARTANLRRRLALTTALCGGFMAIAAPAQAQTYGDFGTVSSTVGTPAISNSGNTLNVSANQNAIINWNDFNVPTNGHTADFRHSGGGGAPRIGILNRVSTGQTTINGNLTSGANVDVYVINPNGVIFGNNARINVGGLVASTLDVDNADFLDGNSALTFTGTSNPGAQVEVRNGAQIRASRNGGTGGHIVLVSPQITNAGLLDAAGEAVFVAAEDVEVNFSSRLSVVIGRGTAIQSAITSSGIVQGKEVLFAVANRSAVQDALLNISGVVTAESVDATDGVYLAGGSQIQGKAQFGPSGVVNVQTGALSGGRGFIAANGDLTALGDYSFQRLVSVGAERAIDLQGVTSASGNISITSYLADLQVGALNAGGSINLSASNQLVVSGAVAAGGAFVADANNTIDLADNVSAGEIQLRGLVTTAHADLTSTAGNIIIRDAGGPFGGATLSGNVSAAGDLDIQLSNALSSLVLGNDTDATSFTAGGSIVISASDIDSADAAVTIAAANAGGDETLAIGRAGSVINLGGDDILRGGRVRITGADVTVGNIEATAVSADALDNVVNVDATMASLGNIASAGHVNIQALDDVSISGNVNSGGNYRVTGAAVSLGADADSELQQALGAVSITATNGLIRGGENLTLASGSGGIGLNWVAANQGFDFADTSTIRAGTNSDQALTLAINFSGLNGIFNFGNITAGSMVDTDGGVIDVRPAVRIGNLTLTNGGLNLNNVAQNDSARAMTLGNVTARGDIILQSAGLISSPSIVSTNGSVEIYGRNGPAIPSTTPQRYLALDIGSITARNAIRLGASLGDMIVDSIESTNGNIVVLSGASAGLENSRFTFGNMLATRGVISVAVQGAVNFTGDLTASTDIGIYALGGGTFAGTVTAPGLFQLQSNAFNTAFGSFNQLAGSRFNVGELSTNFPALSLDFMGANNIGRLAVSAVNDIRVNDVSGGLQIVRPVLSSSNGTVEIRTLGGDLSFLGSPNTTMVSGGLVTLSTDGAFLNTIGSTVVTASNRWAIYAGRAAEYDPVTNPTGNIYGGLDSGSIAYWGSSVDGRNGTAQLDINSLTGNRYIFAEAATLTVRANDVRKTYGQTFNPTAYTISGTPRSGIANAFLGASEDDILGPVATRIAPTLASAGTVANADVLNGGADGYAISVDTSPMQPNYGYTLVADNSGRLFVDRKTVNVGVSANGKTYDGSAAGSGALDFRAGAANGILSGDDVRGNATFTFVDGAGQADKNAGVNKRVSVSNTTYSGGDADNYTFVLDDTSSLAATIDPKIVNAAFTVSKTYDGNRTGSASARFTNADGTGTGVIGTDELTISGLTFTYDNQNWGLSKTVTISGNAAIGGRDAGNYQVTIPTSVIGEILRKQLIVTIGAQDKVYDGTADATGRIIGYDGIVGSESLTLSGGTFTFTGLNGQRDKDVGDKGLSATGIQVSGATADNYVVTTQIASGAAPKITPKAIVGRASVNGKTYDATTNATGSINVNANGGVIQGDQLGATAAFAFADKNAGTQKTVNVTNLQLTGADAGNYTITLEANQLFADILRAVLNVTVRADNKTYDGTTTATGSITGVQGVLGTDSVQVTGGTYAFADKNAGTGKTVTASGFSVGGADAGNYSIAGPATSVADIARRLVTVTVAANGKTYDGTTATTGQITGVNGVVQGDQLNVTGGTYAFADPNAGTSKTVNVSGVTVAGADSGNYQVIIPATVLADILRRAITVRANDVRKMENAADPALTYAVVNGSLVAGDAFTGALSRQQGEAPGTYGINRGTLALSANYDITYQPGTFTIEGSDAEVAVPLTPSPYKSVELGGRAQTLQVNMEPLVWTEPMVPLVCAPGSDAKDDQCKVNVTVGQ